MTASIEPVLLVLVYFVFARVLFQLLCLPPRRLFYLLVLP